MELKDCLLILREIKDVAFATVDAKGMPQVRIIDIMLVEDAKLYFCTARGKEFYHQLMASGHTAITGMNRDYQMVRLNGKARRLEDQKKWIDRIFEENPSMNAVYPDDSRYVLEAFCIDRGQVEFFDLGKTPIYRESFVMEDTKEEQKGYWILESCTGCGACQRACPQKCIEEGTPYRIRQEHCLHCGLCREECPMGAVIKMGGTEC